jgi:hypothetical protein
MAFRPSAGSHPCFWSVASVGPGAAGRRETSAPASGGMLQNKSALVAEISETTIQAG